MIQTEDYHEHPKVNWEEREEKVVCYLKDETPHTVLCRFEVSDNGIIDLKSIHPTGNMPRENFQSLSTDIGEHFGKFNSPANYKQYIGLFQNELQ